MQSTAAYALDNDEPTASSMLDLLPKTLDGFSRQRLLKAGIARGWQCWEIGAGNGSVAQWMFEEVGPRGYSMATDIKTQHIRCSTMVGVKAHDVAAEDPAFPDADLIHARLVFAHLPTRRETLATVAAALKPGRPLVIEDWSQWSGRLLSSPIKGAAGIYDRYQMALRDMFTAAGNDATWALSTAAAMAEAGLVDVDAEVFAETWRGGSPGCLLPVVVSIEKRTQLLTHGATADDLDALPVIMNHPGTRVLGDPLISTIGYRPL